VSHKNKNTQLEKIETFVARIGLTAMSIAAVIGLVELHQARGLKAMPILQPAYAYVADPADHAGAGYFGQSYNQGAGHEFMRREKDEVRHMSVSYGSSMRSHPTAGTI
jgi:hypothetical protein